MADHTAGLWRAVVNRDAAADGLFVYAVTSTRIYCRPSCPSRRPRRERVEFYPAPVMAAAHGYRACRRCRPDDEGQALPATARVRRACAAIAAAPENTWSVTRIARAAGASVPQLQRAFRSALGISPRDYAAACRRQRFLAQLRQEATVTAAVYGAGFGASSRAYDARHAIGMTPATYAKGGKGATIDWLTMTSPIGVILVAATPRGLCWVQVGARARDLRAALADEFPLAVIAARPSSGLMVFADAVRAVATAHRPPEDLPIDARGTAFQWRVWRALRAIPMGQTTAYSDLARSLGTPSATRAVARACAANPLALVVPCHRVIGKDGSLHGYRWGLDVKRQLLAQERQRRG